MVYLEFIVWDRRTPVDIFQILKAQDGWIDEAQDRQVLNVGRHKGLGAKPAHLCGWRIRDLGRVDEWRLTSRVRRARRITQSWRRCKVWIACAAGSMTS